MPRIPSHQAEMLKQWVRNATASNLRLEEPLPTTRELGERFHLSNSTAFRVLQSLKEEGNLWHAPSGRFYASGARPLLERVPPLVFLLRKVEHWSVVYHAIMEGVSAYCAGKEVPVILWSDNLLVQHRDTTRPPSFATHADQSASLARFMERLEGPVSGVILDHIWADAVLRRHSERLPHPLLLYRNSKLPWLSALHLNFGMAAQMAMAHLLGRGYEVILPVRPFSGDEGIDQMLEAVAREASELKIGKRILAPVSVSTPAERKALARNLLRSKKRVAVLSPEDHIAKLLREELTVAGVKVPDQVGLISLQGTKAAQDRGITATAFDFRMMGERAAEILRKEKEMFPALDPVLKAGETT